MPAVTINGRGIMYDTTGDGFPLILIPDAGATLHDWIPAMPLLGELCRVIAYAYDRTAHGQPAQLPLPDCVADLRALLAFLQVERAYLAGAMAGSLTALSCALHHPNRVEGLILIGPQEPARSSNDTATRAAPAVSLRDLTVPTLLIAGEDAAAQVAWATQFALQCPRANTEIIARTGQTPHREQPLQLGHIMVRFLLQCERQRTLVRGASFLL
jgi:pimeloyl-ACP methyl ester carboxylesterase